MAFQTWAVLLWSASRAEVLISPKNELGVPARQSSVREGNPNLSYEQILHNVALPAVPVTDVVEDRMPPVMPRFFGTQ
jgi:hypothetical protein